jgi:O-antigen/teichoic acid export membrane protein
MIPRKIKTILSKQLIKKSGAVLFLRIVGMAFSFLAVLFISNFYGAEVYGRYSLSITLLQFLILIFSLGLTSSVIKLTSDVNFFRNKKPLNRYLFNSMVLLFLSMLICSLLLYFFKQQLAITIFNDVKIISYFNYLSLFIVFGAFHVFFSEYIRGRGKFIHYGVFMYVLPNLLLIAFLFYGKYNNYNEDFIIISYLLSLAILSIVLLYFVPKREALMIKKSYSYRSLLSLSIPMMFSATFIFITNWTDIFMLGAMVSKAEVGIYNAAYKLAILSLVVIHAVNTVLAPKISQLYSENNINEIKNEVQRATKIITYITIPVVLILIIFRKHLLILFGEEFVVGEQVLLIVSIGLLINALSGSVGIIMNMTKHQKELRTFTFIGAIINIFLNYFLIKRFGINGAAIASLLSSILLNIMCIWYIKKYLGFYTFLSAN